MSLTSYQAAPPRVLRSGTIAYIKAGCNLFLREISRRDQEQERLLLIWTYVLTEPRLVTIFRQIGRFLKNTSSPVIVVNH
jgi:hypothetical protein